MVRIITDSAADFEPNELERMSIYCVPMSVAWGSKEFYEGKELSKRSFYEMLENEKEFPHTSQPSPFALERILTKLQQQGDETVVITISSALSGTYQSAVAAKNRLEYENCFIVDSLSATGGEHILVEQAVKMRNAGKNAFEIVTCLKKLRSRIRLFACMDTLEYLYKGGRISQAVYSIGSAANIKPILTLSQDGKVRIPVRTLGMKRGMNLILKKIQEQSLDLNYPCHVMYTDERQNGVDFLDYLKENRVRLSSGQIMQVGAAIGSYIGTGAVGIVYVTRDVTVS